MIDELKKKATLAYESMHVLFCGTDMGAFPFVSQLDTILQIISQKELHLLEFAEKINCLSELCKELSFASQIDRMLFQRLVHICGSDFRHQMKDADSDCFFYYNHAVRLATTLQNLIPDTIKYLHDERLNDTSFFSPIRPSANTLHSKSSRFLKLKIAALSIELEQYEKKNDIFSKHRIFRYIHGEFEPVNLNGIRNINEFYGYNEARNIFFEHFSDFSTGKSNYPLLISSLPGLGKTQMTIAHALHFSDIVLIIASPDDISLGLENLVHSLTSHTNHKFMLFFDDIDVKLTDWYYFRTNIGGAFSLPMHISVTISSNQEFPANILSRGRGFSFPMFDEIRCQEMIDDFLTSKGMKSPRKELISVIAADYVGEFGQKKFEELSPRTLVRYLDLFLKNSEKRKLLLDTSNGEVIPQPDPQVFYEENVKLMCSIHGPEILKKFQKESLNFV